VTFALGLSVPLTRGVFSARERALVEHVVADGLVDSLWVRDLPVVPHGDNDAGQGTDPFVHLADLAARGALPPVAGTASVILGARHPLVIAQSAASLVHLLGAGFVLGLGSGGKPVVAQALGLDRMEPAELGEQWQTVRRALRGEVSGAVGIALPPGFVPPPMYLASDDAAKWNAIDGAAEGWMTFLADAEQLASTRARIAGSRTTPLAVLARVDLNVGGSGQPVQTGPRGRVGCGRDALADVVRAWSPLPLDHVVVNLTSDDPLGDLRTIRRAVGAGPSPMRESRAAG
jgi:alkanesulfonate monooxygenase SsuD/methylene tetrahydromethanopterin reductase-like flavin-dependent oxidoreductase (luciferase family)